MTPLAHRLTREFLGSRRNFSEEETTFQRTTTERMSGAHFFEVTQALPLIPEVTAAMGKTPEGDLFVPLTYLPAPKAWVEWKLPGAKRCAVMLLECNVAGRKAALVSFYYETGDGSTDMADIGVIRLDTGRLAQFAPDQTFTAGRPVAEDDTKLILATASSLLAIINSPRIVGRRTHAPHKGLERELKHSPGVGIGPLHDWHEIKLEVTKPRDIHDGEPHADKITGKRALHFCRKHIRIRLGKLEYVRAHWRGDPSIGIRRATYAVTAPGGSP